MKRKFSLVAIFALIFIVAFLALILTTFVSEIESTSLYWIGEGLEAYGEGEYEKAMDFFNKALSRDPDYIDGWDWRRAALEQLSNRPPSVVYTNEPYDLSFKVPWEWIIGQPERTVAIQDLEESSRIAKLKFVITLVECKNASIWEGESTYKFRCGDNLSLAAAFSVAVIGYIEPIEDFDKEVKFYTNTSNLEKKTINNKPALIHEYTKGDRREIEVWVKCNDRKIIQLVASAPTPKFKQHQEEFSQIINSFQCS